jgi:hypothetical protein
MEQRIRFIEHAGRAILLMDFSEVWRVDAAASLIEEARRVVGAETKEQKLLVLVHVTDSAFDDRVLRKLKELAVHDEPWVLASAVVGMRGMQKVVYRLVASFSGRKLAAFDGLEEAKNWLVAQQRPPDTVPGPKP